MTWQIWQDSQLGSSIEAIISATLILGIFVLVGWVIYSDRRRVTRAPRRLLLGPPGRFKLDEIQRRKLESAVAELNLRQPYYGTIRANSFLSLSISKENGPFRRPGVVSFYLRGGGRPGSSALVAWDEAVEKFLLPSVNEGDFIRLTQLLGLRDISQIVGLSVILDRFNFKSLAPPARIASAEDASRCGFEFTPEMGTVLTSHTTLWWSKAGGVLFSFTFEPDTTPPRSERRNVATLIGDYYSVGPIR